VKKNIQEKLPQKVKPFTKFYNAEEYHQEYILHHPENPYVQNVSIPDFERFRKEFKGNFKS
jgi:peptide-methionine (S)-S-oxide reductase